MILKSASNHALFALARYFNELVVYRRIVIDPVRESHARMFEMRPTDKLLHEELSVNAPQLFFLANQGEGTLLMEVVLEESRFRSILSWINERAVLHLHRVQPALEAAGIREREAFT